MDKKIVRLCQKLTLGNVYSMPVQVKGGLLHKMYHVITEKGNYAIKVLNPDIMKRKEALNNMITSEIIANKIKPTISLIAAEKFDEKYVIKFEEQYFIIYNWIDANSIFGDEIKEVHCVEIGNVLGKIHSLNIEIANMEKESYTRKAFDWNFYLRESKKQHAHWSMIYEENIEKIIQWDKKAIESVKTLKNNQVISHRDLDPKNVLWKQESLYIIDWEAAGYINPYQELVEVLNYWTVDSSGGYEKDKLNGLIRAYTKNYKIENVDWDAVLYSSFDGMIGWLEYNLKRALGMESIDSESIKVGIEQVIGTINEINQYQLRIELLRNYLSVVD